LEEAVKLFDPPDRLRAAQLYRFSDNRITASQAHGQKNEEIRNNLAGATAGSQTCPHWKT
jgi:hypothetical protein